MDYGTIREEFNERVDDLYGVMGAVLCSAPQFIGFAAPLTMSLSPIGK